MHAIRQHPESTPESAPKKFGAEPLDAPALTQVVERAKDARIPKARPHSNRSTFTE